MPELDDYTGQTPAWCPGCGNFSILRAFKLAVVELGLAPHQFTVVSGIGQSGKFPHYTKCNTFNGLHGRTLPVATGAKLANHTMLTIAVAGDGDCYGEGGNHLIHAMRRNIDVKIFVHDNQVYGLTKGQASPTTMEGTRTTLQPQGVASEAMNPMALGVALDCSFVVRAYAGDVDRLKDLMKETINHKGFALLDILQPCVTYNKVNTYSWFKERVYYLDSSYNPEDRTAAFAKALEFGDRIPLGVLYRHDRPLLHETFPALKDATLVNQPFDPVPLQEIIREFY
jgi:2-oxoglutarate/2-oxoacid ferredoxin oxidoreductase subunit beta